MPIFESFLPSDKWQRSRVHWHAYAEIRERDTPSAVGDRIARRERSPDAVLRTPLAVASWIDQQTREYVLHREVWANFEGQWVSIGDEDDLEHLRQENFGIASRGDSIYTDIYSETERYDLYVEATTDDQCAYGCITGASGIEQ